MNKISSDEKDFDGERFQSGRCDARGDAVHGSAGWRIRWLVLCPGVAVIGAVIVGVAAAAREAVRLAEENARFV
jgi:hypothetical protein